jgi:16S rRNA (guanine527-N7)-methyltransferase
VFHVKHEGWTETLLTGEQRSLLERYEALLRRIAIPKGMVAASDAGELWGRHIRDALRLMPLLPADAARLCDLGSGAGLPGIPLAAASPGLQVTLAESRSARIAFLELTVERLGLANVTVFPGRAEELPEASFDVCAARGFANAAGSWSVADLLLRPFGRLAYWAGRSFDPADVPAGALAEQVGEPTLESGGPIVIMTRR